MKVIIVHYHLNPGGVTRIIQSQIEGLRAINPAVDIVLITGACEYPADFNSVKLCVIPEINYLSDALTQEEVRGLLIDLRNKLTLLCSEGDILHIHNMNLGKNPVLTAVFFHLAGAGYRILNHCHDFAEDRPVNRAFMKEILENKLGLSCQQLMYPSYRNLVYAVLNRFDHERLLQLGVPSSRCFFLPNPVHIHKDLSLAKSSARDQVADILTLDSKKIFVVYPVRVIARKNIGEFILLAWIFRKKAHFMVTLAPQNPKELKLYQQWKSFCQALSIPVCFEVGESVDFDLLMRGCDFCLTTSRMEGFGMAFMEPWLYETPVVGRNLPSVTSDLRSAGMLFPVLYDALWVDTPDGMKSDFSTLSESVQRAVIERIMREGIEKQLVSNNPWISGLLQGIEERDIQHNRQLIANHYTIEQYGKKLFDIYQGLIG